jgi:sugar lactone lactonase YvrE
MSEVRLVWAVGALLGEGPVWLADPGVLRFVDIVGGRIHAYDPLSGATETLEVGGKPSFIVPSVDGGLFVGSGLTVHRLEGETLGEAVAAVPEHAGIRTNDATVDALGRLWFGTMDHSEGQPTGAIWCLARGELHRAGGRAVVTNGPAVNGDGSVLYHVDSSARIIWRCSLGAEHRLGPGEVFVRLDEDEGYPDGVVVDAEDCLWVALWDGWGVRRYAPDGSLLAHIPFPCARVTKVAFGGPDLRTAFVTTARVGLDPEALEAQPDAGGLFAFAAPAAGRVVPPVRLQ